jgi:hypothetical protein
MAGGSSEASPLAARLSGVQLEVIALTDIPDAVLAFGIIPSPLLHRGSDAARAVFG